MVYEINGRQLKHNENSRSTPGGLVSGSCILPGAFRSAAEALCTEALCDLGRHNAVGRKHSLRVHGVGGPAIQQSQDGQELRAIG